MSRAKKTAKRAESAESTPAEDYLATSGPFTGGEISTGKARALREFVHAQARLDRIELLEAHVCVLDEHGCHLPLLPRRTEIVLANVEKPLLRAVSDLPDSSARYEAELTVQVLAGMLRQVLAHNYMIREAFDLTYAHSALTVWDEANGANEPDAKSTGATGTTGTLNSGRETLKGGAK